MNNERRSRGMSACDDCPLIPERYKKEKTMYRIMAITKDRLKGMYLPIRFADYDLAMKYVSELVELYASFGIDHLDYEIEETSNDADIQIQKSLERLLVASQERMQESLRSLAESTNKLSKEFEAFKTRAEQAEEDKGDE